MQVFRGLVSCSHLKAHGSRARHHAAWRPVDVPAADRCTQARGARRTVPRLVHQTSAAFISAASRLPDNTRIDVEGESGETV